MNRQAAQGSWPQRPGLAQRSGSSAWPALRYNAPGLVLGAVALLLALRGLDRRSVWNDEALTVEFAGKGVGGLLRWIGTTQGEANMSAYYLLIAPVVEWSESPVAIRLPSVLAYAALVYVTWRIGSHLFSPGPAILAPLGVLLVGLGHRYAQEARSYMLAALLVALAVLLALEARSDGGLAWCGAVFGASLWFHVTVAVALPVLVLAILTPQDRGWRQVGGVAAIVGALAIPLGILMSRNNQLLVSWIPEFSLHELDTYLTDVYASEPWLARVGAALMVAAGIWVAIRRGVASPRSWLPVVWLAGPVIGLVLVSEWYRPSFVDRYLVLALPGTGLVLAALGQTVMDLQSEWQSLKQRSMEIGAGVALVLTLAAMAGPRLNSERHVPDSDGRAAMEFLLSRDGRNDVVTTARTNAQAEYYRRRLPGAESKIELHRSFAGAPDGTWLYTDDSEDPMELLAERPYCPDGQQQFTGLTLTRLVRC